jgi:hypothetical protein
MRETVALNTAVAASSTLAARAVTGLSVAIRALGGPVGIAISGIILFGDSILQWIDKARGMTPELKKINDQIERSKQLTSQGITPGDVMADEKTKINETIRLIATLQEQRDRVARMGKNAGPFMMFTTPKEKLAEIDAQISQGRKNILDYSNAIAQAADTNAGNTSRVSEEYVKLNKHLVTNKELALAYSRDMTTVMVEGKKAGLPDDEIIAKLAILKEKYDKATGATKEATKAKKDQAKTLKELQDELRAEDLLVERSANIQDLLKEKMDEVNKVQIETQKTIDDKIAKLIIEIDTYGKTEAAIEATNLSRLTERKILLEAKGENVDALNKEIAARMQLVELTAKKEQLDRDKKEADKEAKDALKEEASMVKELERIYDGFARNSAQAMTDFFTNTKTSFSDMVSSILKDLLRLSIQKSITEPLFNSISNALGGAGGIGGFFSGLIGGNGGVSATAGAYSIDQNPYLNYGGADAAGGPVNPNHSYLVGERGAEMFVPQATGSIVPLNKMGSNVSVVINNNSSSQASANETIDSRGNRKIEVTIGDMVAGEIRRNGSGANQAIRNTFNARPTLVGR